MSLFFKEALRAPTAMTFVMRLMLPVWRKMTAMARTTEYDVVLCEGLQDGRPIPDRKWTNVSVPVLVLVGEKSEPWLHTSATAVADRLGAQVQIVPKAHHGSPTMQPQVLMPQLREFLHAG